MAVTEPAPKAHIAGFGIYKEKITKIEHLLSLEGHQTVHRATKASNFYKTMVKDRHQMLINTGHNFHIK